jgi:pyruvate dehydrogenase E1 component alpha subunit
MKEVLIPATGFAMTEALLVRWYKQPGDPVSIGEPLAEIETDKVTADLESPAAGILGVHLAEAGSYVPVGIPLTRILEIDDAAAVEMASARDDVASVGSAAEPSPTAPATATAASETTVSSTPSAGSDERRPSPRQRKLARPEAAATSRSSAGAGSTAVAAPVVDGTRTEQASPPTVGSPTGEDLRGWLETMLLIREFEGRCDPLALAGKIPGGVHLSIGQEAVAVGVIRALAPGDLVAGTHRSHHHALAMGLEPRRVMAELLGKASGTNGGRSGSMHIADLGRGFIGGNGIVGAGVGLAMGAALGAAYTGRTWEAANMAAIWDLPLIVVCENNLYAVETATASVTAATSIVDRASAFGLHAVAVDGQDVEAIHAATSEARQRALNGGGPTFIEARTYRYEGHNTGQVVRYRSPEEVEEWRTRRDPVERLTASLLEAGAIDPAALDEMTARNRAIVDEAIAFAESDAWPDPSSALDGVTSFANGAGAGP